MEADGWELATWGSELQRSSVAPQKGSHRVRAPVCLLLALSMGTMCARVGPRSAGTVSMETWDGEFSRWPGGSGWDGSSRGSHHRHPQSIKPGWRACLRPNSSLVSGIIDCLLIRSLYFLSHHFPALSHTSESLQGVGGFPNVVIYEFEGEMRVKCVAVCLGDTFISFSVWYLSVQLFDFPSGSLTWFIFYWRDGGDVCSAMGRTHLHFLWVGKSERWSTVIKFKMKTDFTFYNDKNHCDIMTTTTVSSRQKSVLCFTSWKSVNFSLFLF